MSIVQFVKHPGSACNRFIPGLLLLTLLVVSCATLPVPSTPEPQAPLPTEPPPTQEFPQETPSLPENPQLPENRTLEKSPPLPLERSITIRVFPQNLQVETWDGHNVQILSSKEHKNDLQIYETRGTAFRLSAPGYKSKTIFLEENQDFLEAKLEKTDSPLTFQGELPTNFNPKVFAFPPTVPPSM